MYSTHDAGEYAEYNEDYDYYNSGSNIVQPATPNVGAYKAIYPFTAQQAGDLGLKIGDIVTVTNNSDAGWWYGTLNGITGTFPANYVEKVPDVAQAPSLSMPPAKQGIGTCVAIADWYSNEPNDLEFVTGDKIVILNKGDGWWQGTANGRTGYFPSTYVQETQNKPTVPQQTSTPSPQPSQQLPQPSFGPPPTPPPSNQQQPNSFSSPRGAPASLGSPPVPSRQSPAGQLFRSQVAPARTQPPSTLPSLNRTQGTPPATTMAPRASSLSRATGLNVRPSAPTSNTQGPLPPARSFPPNSSPFRSSPSISPSLPQSPSRSIAPSSPSLSRTQSTPPARAPPSAPLSRSQAAPASPPIRPQVAPSRSQSVPSRPPGALSRPAVAPSRPAASPPPSRSAGSLPPSRPVGSPPVSRASAPPTAGPPPPPAGGPPPPPAAGPPPPPPSAPKMTPPPKTAGRGALLKNIEGFSKNKLKKSVTNDRSKPILTKEKPSGGGGGMQGGLFAGGIPQLKPRNAGQESPRMAPPMSPSSRVGRLSSSTSAPQLPTRTSPQSNQAFAPSPKLPPLGRTAPAGAGPSPRPPGLTRPPPSPSGRSPIARPPIPGRPGPGRY